MDAVAYIRVSTNKEEQELSLENQREFFEKYVGNRNDTLIRIYSDKGKSATKMKNRKDLQAYERTHAVENHVRDDAKQLVCFGREYKVDFNKVLETPENYTDLINVLKTPEEDVWKTFCKAKEYYEGLVTRYGT